MTTAEEHIEHTTPSEKPHPGAGEYVKVAVVLAIVTAVEVGAYYVAGLPDGVLAASLLVMMAIKFFMVGAWFMHLRFDAPIFRRLFAVGIALALAVYTVVLLTFGLILGG